VTPVFVVLVCSMPIPDDDDGNPPIVFAKAASGHTRATFKQNQYSNAHIWFLCPQADDALMAFQHRMCISGDADRVAWPKPEGYKKEDFLLMQRCGETIRLFGASFMLETII
jgi:hypothetical protein